MTSKHMYLHIWWNNELLNVSAFPKFLHFKLPLENICAYEDCIYLNAEICAYVWHLRFFMY